MRSTIAASRATGLMQMQPAAVAAILTVTPSNASEVGSRLWAANHDSNNYGGPRAALDPELLAEINPDEVAAMPEYEFEPLPGVPRPQTAIRLAGYCAYQPAGDYWDSWEWPNGEPPFEMLFHQAMVWTAAGLLGIERPEEPQNYTPFEDSARRPELPRFAPNEGGCQTAASRRTPVVRSE